MRILLPTDYSENSWHAIQYAVYLFGNTDATFFLMHAHQSGPSALVSTINKERDTRLHQITHDETMVKLHKMTTQLNKINKKKDHHFKPLLESDALVQAVGRLVIDHDVDYIVMGTQGASGFKEVFLGSNTVRIIKNINFCPLIAVPQSYNFCKPGTIAFATDYKHNFEPVEMKPLLDIAQLWESTIRVIHMSEMDTLDTEQKRLKDHLFKQFASVESTYDILEYHPTLAYRISEWATTNNVDLLAMFHSTHGFFDKLLREPVIKKIAFSTQMPFLVLPEAS